MYYNFQSLNFKYGSASYNQGYFTSIQNGSTTYSSTSNASEMVTGEQLFKTAEASNVRTLTIPEINKGIGRTDIDNTTTISNTEDIKGLFRLDQVKSAPGISSISNTGYYWIASPAPVSTSNANVSICGYDGSWMSANTDTRGVRPVVSLQGSNLKLEPVGTEGTYRFVAQ